MKIADKRMKMFFSCRDVYRVNEPLTHSFQRESLKASSGSKLLGTEEEYRLHAEQPTNS